jgi:hypothetical protein
MDGAAATKQQRPASAKPRASVALLIWARKLHLYSGALFAPALLFFAVTGLLQVYKLHETRPGTDYQPPALIQRLGALHKNQTFALPRKRDGAGKPKSPTSSPQPPRAPPPMSLAQTLLKLFAAAVAVGLFATTCLGLYMAYRLSRNPWLVSGLLVAGVVIPVGLIWAMPG